MSEETFDAALYRILRYCISTNQQSVSLTFHGGEPTLLGVKKFDAWCVKAQHTLKNIKVGFSIQTNGTLLNQAWAEVFIKHNVDVGVSMDGPPSLQNAYRVDHKGQGSYDALEQGLATLREASIPFGILSVIPLGEDPLKIHRHFIGLGCKSIAYLMPHYTYDTIAPIRELHGTTPCADFLIPIFDEWWFNSNLDIRIRNFWNISRLILGGYSQVDSLGNGPYSYIFVEADGEIEGLDILRTCDEELYRTGLTVYEDDFQDVIQKSELHTSLLTGNVPLPQECRSCPEHDTCAGGYFPNRYSRERKFDNPSVWCADLLRLFRHIRQRMDVSIEETNQRRQALQNIILNG